MYDVHAPTKVTVTAKIPAGMRQLYRDNAGSAAVEFAIIGNVLILLLVGFLLMGIFQFWQMTLDDAVRSAARKLQSGTVTTSSQFVTAVCSEFGSVAPCNASNLQVEMQANTASMTFSGITPATVSSSGTLSPQGGFASMPFTETGTPVLVQVAYRLPILIPLIPVVLETGNATDSLISSVSIMAYAQ
jgi:Flp pilus assembly protein TadG